MITSDTPERQYSTRLRTALVMTGSGTAGAYHAGVLHALHEAGVKIDLVAGCGVGVLGALFAAVDGGSRLWEPAGFWKGEHASRFYLWRLSLRAAGWALVAAAFAMALPIVLLAVGVLVAIAGLFLTLIGFPATATEITATFTRWIDAAFSPGALPVIVPRLVLFAILAGLVALAASLVVGTLGARARRRQRQGLFWRLIGAPLSHTRILDRAASELWKLIRGAAPLAAPRPSELARKYVELLTENLGQPGFRELLLTLHDEDARRDLVFALLRDTHRARFFARPGGSEAAANRFVEAFDLGGASRDYAFDALAGALAAPIATEPHLFTFSPEGPWRGETHRVCDRPGAASRLLEEVAAAGAEQVILLTAAPPPGRPHELSAGRADLRGRAGEQLAAFETAGLRDVLEQFGGRFARLFVIRPAHNPLGPFDFGGVYDERSDRVHTLGELADRGYEDAYRQFIEPIVGASGERIETVKPVGG